MTSFASAIPAILGRSILSPINALPKRFTETSILVGASSTEAESQHDASLAQSDKPSSPPSPPPRFTTDSLAKLLDACPSLKHYYPHPLLPLGSVQTMYSAVADTVAADVVRYKRHTLILPDGGTIAADVSPPEWDDNTTEEEQKRKTIVINHGLTGGSHESYVRHVIPPLIDSGFRCVVINFRGCGQTPVTSTQMYSAAKTDDLRCGLLYVLNRWEKTEVALMGFSLGANVVAKYLGEEGDNAPVKGGVVLATPFDLKLGSDELAKSALYDKVMNTNLTKKIGLHSGTLGLDPDLRDPLRRLLDSKKWAAENPEELKRRQAKPGTLKWVDDSATRILGGHSKPYGDFPFASADDYYNANGSIHRLHNVARPLLLLNSDNDPIVPFCILERTQEAMAQNPNVVLAITRGGGHLGWWTARGLKGATKPVRWLGKVTQEWAEQLFAAGITEQASDYQGRTDVRDAVKEVAVEYELLSEEEVLPFDFGSSSTSNGETKQLNDEIKKNLPKEVKPDTDESPPSSKAPPSQSVDDKGPRHAWLLTPLLPGYTLVHPSKHPSWSGVKHPHERELISGATMLQSTRLPQVGYLELAPESRVAGCGEIFQGGVSVPGQSSDTRGFKVGGKKGKKRGVREEGTVAGI